MPFFANFRTKVVKKSKRVINNSEIELLFISSSKDSLFSVLTENIHWKKKMTKKIWPFFCRGLTNLVDLDLSDNALDSVPTSAVEDCKYLMRLSLRSNHIRSVGQEAFRGLHEMVHLDLSQCGLEDVHPYAFRGLDSLEYLRLEANRLTTLSPTQSFPPKLR